jgi:NAD+ diphosphatase
MSYPEAINLPFNGEIIKSRFTQRKPGEVAESQEAGYWAVLQGDALVVSGGGLYLGELPAGLVPKSAPICFGEWDGKPIRLCTVSRELALPDSFQAVSWGDLDDELMTIYGLARQILYWEKTSRHCSKCGSSTGPIPTTWGKLCAGCGHEHYPHIHPCVIVLVRRGEEFLLARKPEWAPGRYSLVAGFVDFGESLEECVEREVLEETGIRVSNVRYVGSQNWPFPSQLMAGFIAEYASGDILLDGAELEDARWFRRDQIPDALPPSRSIARWIIDRFAVAKGNW